MTFSWFWFHLHLDYPNGAKAMTVKELSGIYTFIKQETFSQSPNSWNCESTWQFFAYSTGTIYKVLFLLYNRAFQNKKGENFTSQYSSSDTKIPRSGLESRDFGRNSIGSGHAGSAPTLLLGGRNAKLGTILGRCGFGSDSGNYSDSNARPDSELNLSPIPVHCKMFRFLRLEPFAGQNFWPHPEITR